MDITKLTLDEMQDLIGSMIRDNPSGHALWDVLTCLRGPDAPSERESMGSREREDAYRLRRARKRNTVEVIRWYALKGVVGGSARYRTDRDWVELPPYQEWDHFDKHVERAARQLGLTIKIGGEK